MEGAARAVASAFRVVAVLFLLFLFFKVPITGAYKLTTGTFAVVKWLIVIFAIIIGVKNYKKTSPRL